MKIPQFEMERMQSTWENLVEFDMSERHGGGGMRMNGFDMSESSGELERIVPNLNLEL